MEKQTLFVSTDGNDEWSGAYPEPLAAGNDGPLRTLVRARDTIRERKSSGAFVGPVTISIRGGFYELGRPFRLEAADSGSRDAPITYRAFENEQVILAGGRRITEFVAHEGSILKADLRDLGLSNGRLRQLIFNGERQPMARYPNHDPARPYTGGWAYVDGDPVPMYEEHPSDTRRMIQYCEKDTRTWAHPEDAEVYVFARYNWWNNIIPVASVDRETRTLTLSEDASYAIRPGDRYFVQGPLEELDAPGEWHFDPRTRTLYFWPPEPIEHGTVLVPALDHIIEMAGCNNVVLRGFVLELCDGTAVRLDDCSDVLIAGNTIRNVRHYHGNGVEISGGFRNGVVGNDIHHIGRDAIRITGGDRITLTPGESFADNNYIHHPGFYFKWGCGVTLHGAGLRAAYNLIHDCPRAAIQFMGNNLVMEFNHLRHLCLESEDAAGVGTGGRDWISSRGSAVRYNLIHDVVGLGRRDGRWVSPHFSWAIYLDDNTGGVDVVGNIVFRSGRAGLHLHNARDIVVENNVFVDNAPHQIELNGWHSDHPYWKRHLATMIPGYESVIAQPAWKGMRGMDIHPADAVLPSGLVMSGNRFERNIVVAGDPDANLYMLRRVDFEHNHWDRNLLWQHGALPRISDLGNIPPEGQWSVWRDRGQDGQSVVADPEFIDADADDYRLRPGSPAFALGFEPIPVERIGPYHDELRASWPIAEAAGARERGTRV